MRRNWRSQASSMLRILSVSGRGIRDTVNCKAKGSGPRLHDCHFAAMPRASIRRGNARKGCPSCKPLGSERVCILSRAFVVLQRLPQWRPLSRHVREPVAYTKTQPRSATRRRCRAQRLRGPAQPRLESASASQGGGRPFGQDCWGGELLYSEGTQTASGEKFNSNALTAAHPTLVRHHGSRH